MSDRQGVEEDVQEMRDPEGVIGAVHHRGGREDVHDGHDGDQKDPGDAGDRSKEPIRDRWLEIGAKKKLGKPGTLVPRSRKSLPEHGFLKEALESVQVLSRNVIEVDAMTNRMGH